MIKCNILHFICTCDIILPGQEHKTGRKEMITSQEGIRIISERVRNYRIDFPLTQKQLSDRSGVSLRSIQRFENGEDIQLGNLIKLLSALGLDNNVEMLVPDVTKRPAAFVEPASRRQRVHVKKGNKSGTNEPFQWGDEK